MLILWTRKWRQNIWITCVVFKDSVVMGNLTHDPAF